MMATIPPNQGITNPNQSVDSSTTNSSMNSPITPKIHSFRPQPLYVPQMNALQQMNQMSQLQDFYNKQAQQAAMQQRSKNIMNQYSQHNIAPPPPHPQSFNLSMNAMTTPQAINTMNMSNLYIQSPSHSMPSPNMMQYYQQQQQQQQHYDNEQQQQQQAPLTTFGCTSAPSVTSLGSLSSFGGMKMGTMTTASSFGGNANDGVNNQKRGGFTSLSGNQNNNNQQQPGGNNNNNNNNQQNNNQNNEEKNNDNNDNDKNDEEAKNEPSAVLGQPPNSIIVNVSSNNKYGLRNYLVRARRILRLAKKCKICGIGSAVSVACEVTEVLKRENVAIVVSISTGLIVDAVSERPTIEVIIKRGQFAHLVSDFRRRKVIEVFEKKDVDINGHLSFDFVRKLDLAHKFKADSYRCHQANKYIQELIKEADTDSNGAMDLPRFIHYCSIIIHPLLLEYHFKMAISELGGFVDVHDGHLPREHSEEKVNQLQELGRIAPFLYGDKDDVEFDPANFKHWFPQNTYNQSGGGYNDSNDRYDSYGGGGYERDRFDARPYHSKPYSFNARREQRQQIPSFATRSLHQDVRQQQAMNNDVAKYPTPFLSRNVRRSNNNNQPQVSSSSNNNNNNDNEDEKKGGSHHVDDDEIEDKKADESALGIPENESIDEMASEMDDSKEIENKQFDAESEVSQTQIPSVSSATTMTVKNIN